MGTGLKYFAVLSMFCLQCYVGHSQKLIEKKIRFEGKEWLVLKIQIADSIRISTWDKDEISIRASVKLNDDLDNEKYKMTFDSSSKNVVVDAKIVNESNADNQSPGASLVTWDIYIPAAAKVSVETINGNIIMSGRMAELTAQTISGFIDLSVPSNEKYNLKFSTIRGTLYSSIEINDIVKNKSAINEFSGSINGGGIMLALKTIAGDIFLRKLQ